ncbi:NAD+ synthase [Siculibacillus lacustris]|uniref:Glutamine-dependent NAD(+) synthetase n=1 Tax=Siculibacillus lacustris TaxID=1549641 RepID=A0A4V2KUC2_9HYPH|nr:NAD+ synthase [Siculibacillus lacustris]TBW40896.1 NAD+ synthase [Siculibacillus lacustris]
MTDRLLVALAQIAPVVGDVAGNLAKARAARAAAAERGADLVLFCELFLAGYPPEDLVLKPAFHAACMTALTDLAADTADGGPAVLIGLPWRDADGLHNTHALLDAGKIAALRHKVDLPNYGPFDEKRVFVPGPLPGPFEFRGVRIGVPICEDIWGPAPVACIAETGGEILLVPNASPYRAGVLGERFAVATARVAAVGLPLLYLNQLGGQDELVFEGASFALDADGSLAVQLPAFREALEVVELTRRDGRWRVTPGTRAEVETGVASDYAACVLGLRDYVDKNRFPGVVLGLSGGIDSALVAAMAVDALGAPRVHAVMLPYRWTSSDSLEDAAACADALGIRYDVVPIGVAVDGFEALLAPVFAGRAADITEENLQSRTRGTILMAISNKFGPMVLTTGNKSEMSVGYATLYGDMNGGFNPIKDLYKTEVYAAAAWRNANRPVGSLGPAGVVIPERIITKAPSAELRENQTDQDSLPPYDILDGVLERLVEKEMAVVDIVAEGYDEALVRRIERLLYVAEYKRRQAAPGVKITARNFGRDRRYPITNGFRDPGRPVDLPEVPVSRPSSPVVV